MNSDAAMLNTANSCTTFATHEQQRNKGAWQTERDDKLASQANSFHQSPLLPKARDTIAGRQVHKIAISFVVNPNDQSKSTAGHTRCNYDVLSYTALQTM